MLSLTRIIDKTQITITKVDNKYVLSTFFIIKPNIIISDEILLIKYDKTLLDIEIVELFEYEDKKKLIEISFYYKDNEEKIFKEILKNIEFLATFS